METKITYGLREEDGTWFPTVNGAKIRPGAQDKQVAQVFLRWLRGGACRDLWDIKENVLDKAFAKQNMGR